MAIKKALRRGVLPEALKSYYGMGMFTARGNFAADVKKEVGLARMKSPPDLKLLSRQIEIADGSQLFRLRAKPTDTPVKSF